jgi:hypothetical protein
VVCDSAAGAWRVGRVRHPTKATPTILMIG